MYFPDRSALKYQIRCVEAFANGKGFAAGSVEGRVAYEYFNPALNATRAIGVDHPAELSERKSYAFRCHREKITDEDMAKLDDPTLTVGSSEKIYPVNAIAFHNK